MNMIINVQTRAEGMYAPDARQAARHTKAKQADIKRNTVFAGDMNSRTDSISARKQRAQREALRLVSRAFSADRQTDRQQQERLETIEELRNKNKESGTRLGDIAGMQDALMKEYGITEDSQEYEDLQLMRKVNTKEPRSEVNLTKEELTRYGHLHEQGMTEYQEQALSLDEEAEDLRSEMRRSQSQITQEEKAYRDVKMERLKKAPMAGAVEEAGKIMDAAGKEIVGKLFYEVKENIDEKAKEIQEKQQEKEEKEEAQSKTAGKKSVQGRTAQNMKNGKNTDRFDVGMEKVGGIGKEIWGIMDRMRLLREDIKGAVVDDRI